MFTSILQRSAHNISPTGRVQRVGRLGVVLAVMTASMVGLGAWTSVARAAVRAQASQAQSLPALEQMSRCVREKKNLLALLVIDESGSLKKTDPENQRVTAAKTAIESLAGLAEHEIDGVKPTVVVAVGGFSVDYESIAPWTPLNYGAIDALNVSIDSLAKKNRGIDTDYAAALIGARKSIDEQTTKTTGGVTDAKAVPCRALLWFTDGKYDIQIGAKREVTTKEYAPSIRLDTSAGPGQLITAGKDLLCRPAGLVDALREASITNVALALTQDLKPEDQAFLNALTTGVAPGGGTCGSVDGTKLGAFIPVNDLSELIASLDTIASLLGYGVQGKPEIDMAVCVDAPCPEGERSFPVDVGMNRFRLTAQTAATDVNVVLKSPAGVETFVPKPGATQPNRSIGTASVRSSWLAADVVSFDVDLPAANDTWAGPWTLTFVRPGGPAKAVAKGFRVFYYGTTTARLSATQPNHKADDKSLPVTLEMVNAPKGEPVPARLRTETTVTQTAVLSAGAAPVPVPVSTNADGTASANVSGPAPTGAATLLVTTLLKTKSGFTLAPALATLELPAGYFTKTNGVVTAPTKEASKLPLYGGIAAALLAAIGFGVALSMRAKRSAFRNLADISMFAGAIRVAKDQISQHRLVWLADDGTESAFRLNANTFGPIGTAPAKSFQIGRVSFRRTKTGAEVTDSGSTMVAGENRATLPRTGAGLLVVPETLAPLWVFSGNQTSQAPGAPGSASRYSSTVSPGSAAGSGATIAPGSSADNARTVMFSGNDADNLATQMVRPGENPNTYTQGATRMGARNEVVFEGQLTVLIRAATDVAQLERHIIESLAQTLFV
jgi:von Willebrand factor type A domain